jgi:hypothetical protein
MISLDRIAILTELKGILLSIAIVDVDFTDTPQSGISIRQAVPDISL